MFKKITSRLPSIPSIPTGISNPNSNSTSPGTKDSTTSPSMEKNESDPATSPIIESIDRLSSASRSSFTNMHIPDSLSSKSVGVAASMAASSMMGFMKKAATATTVVLKEGQAKAVELKAKAIDVADMDALQRKLANVLDGMDSDDEQVSVKLNFTYVTDRIVAMGFPGGSGNKNEDGFMRFNPIDKVVQVLNNNHNQHYMIWNFSEEPYDYSKFNEQVLEFKFPGYPAPPLGLLFKICSSIDNWLNVDKKNVAVIHCLTGKGRTGTVIACYLTWDGQAESPMKALEYVAKKRSTTIMKMTIPSQRRYIEYFGNMMDNIRPRSVPLILRRVIMNTIPKFGVSNIGDKSEGCCPIIQAFRNGKLVFTSTWKDGKPEWVSVNEGSYSFNLGVVLQGDILIRCRHVCENGQRLSMFRIAFHTGYVSSGVMRLAKEQIDGACTDKRFENDFFIDFIFDSINDGNPETPSNPELVNDEDEEIKPASSSPRAKLAARGFSNEGVSISNDDREAYDLMLENDQKFWEDIEKRREKRQAAAKNLSNVEESVVSIPEEMEFCILGQEDKVKDSISASSTVARKSSWDEAQENELMEELNSLSGEDKSQKRALSPPPVPIIDNTNFSLESLDLNKDTSLEINKDLDIGSNKVLEEEDKSSGFMIEPPKETSSSTNVDSTTNDSLLDEISNLTDTKSNLPPTSETIEGQKPSSNSIDFDLGNLGIDLDIPVSSQSTNLSKTSDSLNMDELEEYLSSLNSK